MEEKRKKRAEPTKRKRKVSETVVTFFMQLWEDNISELRGCRKNTEIYAEMAEELVKEGYDFRPVDVKYKISNLTRKYRECRAKMGNESSLDTWPAYANVHRIIGNTRTNSIKDLLLESGVSSTSTSVPPPTSPVSSPFATSPPPPPLQSKNDNPSLLSESINNSLHETIEKFKNNLKEAIEIINNNLNAAMESQANFENQFLVIEKKKHEDLLALEKQKVEALQALAKTNQKMVESIMNFVS